MSKNTKKNSENMLYEIISRLDSMQKDIVYIKSNMTGNTESGEKVQNNIIQKLGNVIADQTVALRSSFSSVFQCPQFINMFPIESVSGLKEWENKINDENKPAMVTAVRTLLGSPGIRKNLKLVLSHELMIEVNLEGIHRKTRLNNFKKVMEVLFTASIVPNKPHDFKKDIRKALAAAKNRHHKDECIRKKKSQPSSTCTNNNNLMVPSVEMNTNDTNNNNIIVPSVEKNSNDTNNNNLIVSSVEMTTTESILNCLLK